jgi:hypothetical protein
VTPASGLARVSSNADRAGPFGLFLLPRKRSVIELSGAVAAKNILTASTVT